MGERTMETMGEGEGDGGSADGAERELGGFRVTLRRKLEYLMVIRVLMVTLLLGSAIVVNINDVESFADPSYLAIAMLIIATYVATIVYAVLVPRLQQMTWLAYVQLVGDVVLAAGLIGLTGGGKSVFTVLLYLTIINAAIVVGQTGAFVVATLCGLILLAVLLQRLGIWGVDAALVSTARKATSGAVYSASVNIFACYVVAFLAGNLARRLEERDAELERKSVDIAELQALNQNILSSIGAGVLTVDNGLRVLLLNKGGEELLGRKTADLYGVLLAEGLPELGEAIEALLTASLGLADGSLVRWKGWIWRSGDQAKRFVDVSHSRLIDGGGKPYGHIFFIRDRTAFQVLERRIQRQERLAAVGKLAAAIAHEIRNPLASISGSIEVLQAFSEPDGDEVRLMQIVIREVDRLNHLIESFLDYAKPRRDNREEVHLGEAIEEVVELFQQDVSLNAGITVELALDACDDVRPQGNAQALRQVFWNLLRNAAQAIDGEGTIRVEAEAMRGAFLPDGTLYAEPLDEEQEADVLRLSVHDTGPGIPEDMLDHIFEPFFTTKDQGTGLGLATINRIIEDHDGHISVSSRLGEGSTFEILLPRLPAPQRLASRASSSGQYIGPLPLMLGAGDDGSSDSDDEDETQLARGDSGAESELASSADLDQASSSQFRWK